MKNRTKASIYRIVTIMCVIICLILIGRVIAYEVFGKGREKAEHMPPQAAVLTQEADEEPTPQQADAPTEESHDELEVSTDDGVIAQSVFSAQIGGYLPQEHPLADCKAEIGEDGFITFETRCDADKLNAYMNRAGSQGYDVFGAADISVSVFCSYDDEGGLVAASPRAFSIDGNEEDIGSVPQCFFSELNDGINKLLLATEQTFTSVELKDGAIVLAP